MVAIMGPSGCGKTTLLNCLSGLDSIADGEALIDGTPLSEMSDRERTDYRARRMGFVFEVYNLIPVLTAVENVELPLLVSRVGGGEARERALEALDLVGLAGRAGHVPDELSGGERQRVTIARSCLGRRRDAPAELRDQPPGWPPFGITFHLDYLAAAAAASDRPRVAACLLGRADALRSEIGIRIRKADGSVNEETLRSTQAQLDDQAVAAARAEGSAISLDAAVEKALAAID